MEKHSSKQGWFSKAINVGGWLIGLSRFIEIVMNNLGSPAEIPKHILGGFTFGLSKGGLDWQEGLRFYAPLGGSYGYRKFTSFLMRRFPVR